VPARMIGFEGRGTERICQPTLRIIHSPHVGKMKAPRMLVFIDESGDPGFKLNKGSTALFTVALVAFREADQARATQAAIDATAARLHVRPEFKFSKCRSDVRDAFFEAVQPFEFSIRAIVVQKARIYSALLRSEKEAFYSFFVKSMLKFDDGLLEAAHVIIDGSVDRNGNVLSSPPWQRKDRKDSVQQLGR
jgi:hypothetical protein